MIRFFALHPTAANLLMVLILVLGLFSAADIKRETFPEFVAHQVQVDVVYPGAPPLEVEQALCLPMEDAVDGIESLAEMRCEAMENRAKMTLELAEGGDIQRFLNDIKIEIDAIDSFPDEAEQATVREAGRDERAASVAISGALPQAELKVFAESVKQKILRLDGVSAVDVLGFSQPQLRVELDLAALRQYNLTARDVGAKLAQQNFSLPGGTLVMPGKTVLLKFDEQRLDIAQLKRLPIANSDEGAQILLSDVAQVIDGFEHAEDKVYFDGERAALLNVKKSKQTDTIAVVERLREFIESENHSLPQGLQLTLSQDSAGIVIDRLNMLISNGWQGLLLVVFTMWLFFAWRYSFWVSMGLPVSFIGAMFLMGLMGISINMISMVALLMAIGILMDDAIVLAESIAYEVEQGLELEDAVVKGVQRVAPGVFSSFLTTVVVFSGLSFISGDIGQVLKVLPMVLLATLLVSLVEAFLILPSHLYHSLDHHRGEEEKVPAFKARFQEKFQSFQFNVVPKWVGQAIEYRYAVVGGVVAAFFLSLTLLSAGVLKFKAFPNLEGDVLELRLLLPQGTPLAKTEAIVARMTDSLQKLNDELTPLQTDKQALIQHVTVEFNRNSDAYEQGAHLATIRADLLSSEIRSVSMAEVIQRWRELGGEIPGVIAMSFKEPVPGPAGLAIDIRLQSNNTDTLDCAGDLLLTELQRYLGVYNLTSDMRPGKEEWVISFLPGATAFGINAESVAHQLRSAYFGVKVDDVQKNNDTVELFAQLQTQDRNSLAKLKNFPVRMDDGSTQPLSSLVTIEPNRSYSRIQRVDRIRTRSIIGDIDAEVANTAEIFADLNSRFMPELKAQFPDLEIDYQGEVKEGQSTQISVMEKFGMGIIGIFIILSFQFKSYSEPLMVMLAIPLAMIGVLWGHLLLGYDFTMPSMVGFVSLAGIVVNDSILLVSFIKSATAAGAHAREAAVQAATRRFRAVFITSVTTIIGTTPLMLESSLQAQILQPLVVSLIFGIASSTVLILMILPCLYVIFEEMDWVGRHHLPEQSAESA